jgi:hypothetical protein
MPNFISEDDIEQALLQRLQHLCGYDALNCFTATPDDLNDGSGRTDKREVILAGRLRAAVQRLNPQAPILYVPFVFDPTRWMAITLPNPAGIKTRDQFRVVRSGSVRYRFEQR